jgi:hypothetical protein
VGFLLGALMPAPTAAAPTTSSPAHHLTHAAQLLQIVLRIDGTWRPPVALPVAYDIAYSANVMPSRKRKPKPFKAATAVKAAARKVVGTVPPTRAEPADTRRKSNQEKHKPKLQDLLESTDE